MLRKVMPCVFPAIIMVSLSATLLQQFAQAVILSPKPVVIPTDGEVGVCPAQEKRDAVIQYVTAKVENILKENYSNVQNCGAGHWYRVAYLNMSDPTQLCPSVWREYNSNGTRTCRRPYSSSGSCSGTSYTTGRQYSKVCGRAIGYQYGTTDRYGLYATESIESYYVYGVSFTRGTPRNHIWTLAAGVTEEGSSSFSQYICPCANPSNPDNAVVPSFVGDNYYCESGNPTTSIQIDHLYSSDALWDGEQCEGECCSNGRSPPWFSVELPNPTTDDIEVRICIPQANYDDVVIELL